MSIEITFIRHGETTGNLANTWQSHGDSPLSERGQRQVDAAAKRLAHDGFDLVVSSDLGRAATTARLLGHQPELDPIWREADVGAWEGLTTEEIAERFPDDWESVREGADSPWGGAESRSTFAARLGQALAGLGDRLDDGDRALVVTHGGAIQAAVAAILDFDHSVPAALTGSMNTGMALVSIEDGTWRLASYNDHRHLNGDHDGYRVDASVLLIRHGETEANATQHWQGQSPGVLNAEGKRQIEHMAASLEPLDALYTSPLARAVDTAAAITANQGIDAEVLDDLQEIDMGEWEGMAHADIKQHYREQWQAIYDDGKDLPRGRTGERFAQVAVRTRAAIDDAMTRHNGDTIAMVSHGGALRAFVLNVLGMDYERRMHVKSMSNTAISRVVYWDRGPMLAEYNVAPAPW